MPIAETTEEARQGPRRSILSGVLEPRQVGFGSGSTPR